MIRPIIAMPPPGWGPAFAVGLLLVIVVAVLFVRATAGEGERERRAGLGLLAFLCGPLLGGALTGLLHAMGQIHPLDVVHTYARLSLVGVVAGFVGGLIFASISPRSSNHSRE